MVELTREYLEKKYGKDKLQELEEIEIVSDGITKINTNAFKGLNKLKILFLSQNEISEIDSHAFESLSNLKMLNVAVNKLKTIDPNTFKGLTKLDTLHLHKNELLEIDAKLFSNLSNLKLLSLDNNKLKKLYRKCFMHMKSIEVIELYGNELKALSFFIPSTELEDWKYSRKDLEKNGYLSDWNAFLEQFSEIEKRDPLIGKLVYRKYRVKGVLGEGVFGKVYSVVNENETNSLEKAMKAVKKKEDWDEEENEVDLLQRIRHDNVIRYFEHFDEYLEVFGSDYFCIVCELCENGDLKEKIKQAKTARRNIPDLKIIRWMIEATLGLRYIHDKKIIHRDIKPANILLTRDNVIKLADFGLSKYVESSVASTLTGSRAYMSPQLAALFVTRSTYTKKTDIWSIGCVLFELIELKIAFPTGPQIDSRSLPDLGTSRFVPILEKLFEWEEVNRIDAHALLALLLTERRNIEEEFS